MLTRAPAGTNRPEMMSLASSASACTAKADRNDVASGVSLLFPRLAPAGAPVVCRFRMMSPGNSGAHMQTTQRHALRPLAPRKVWLLDGIAQRRSERVRRYLAWLRNENLLQSHYGEAALWGPN